MIDLEVIPQYFGRANNLMILYPLRPLVSGKIALIFLLTLKWATLFLYQGRFMTSKEVQVKTIRKEIRFPDGLTV